MAMSRPGSCGIFLCKGLQSRTGEGRAAWCAGSNQGWGQGGGLLRGPSRPRILRPLCCKGRRPPSTPHPPSSKGLLCFCCPPNQAGQAWQRQRGRRTELTSCSIPKGRAHPEICASWGARLPPLCFLHAALSLKVMVKNCLPLCSLHNLRPIKHLSAKLLVVGGSSNQWDVAESCSPD